jgi:DNA-binding NarL/FixJ family response regulator
MDIHMSGLSGLKVTTEIKKQYPQSAIVIVTADNQPYLRGMAHLAGATGFVCKENLMELRTLVADNTVEITPASPAPTTVIEN